ncbi:ABZJ_00895 family protein [Roseibium sp. M-1]
MQQSVGLVRFAVVFTVSLFAMAIVTTLLEYFTGINVSGTINQIIAVYAAASDAGQRFYKTYEIVPDSGFAWSAAFQMTLVEVAISLVLGGLFLLLLLSQGELPDRIGSMMIFIATLMLFVFAISLVAKRFVFRSSARQAEKAHLKQQAKSSAVFE